MEWREEGILLVRRLHGENAAIIEVFTENHGRHAGIVRGGAGRKMAPVLQPGTQVDVAWRARLEDHLGSFTVELITSRAASLMEDRKTLAGLNALTAILSFALPEREKHGALYHRTLAVLDMMGNSAFWPLAYVRWELFLLEELGFGLDLDRCAVTDRSDNLVFVSPKSGRAVSRVGAGEWASKMLPLSPALIGEGEGSSEDIKDALSVTGHFLQNWVAASLGNRSLPEARARLVNLLARN